MEAKILKFPAKTQPKSEAELSQEEKKAKEEKERAAHNAAVIKSYKLTRP